MHRATIVDAAFVQEPYPGVEVTVGHLKGRQAAEPSAAATACGHSSSDWETWRRASPWAIQSCNGPFGGRH